jgi:hypothetical protein
VTSALRRWIPPVATLLAALASLLAPLPARAVLVPLPQVLTVGTANWDVRNIGGTDNGLPTGGTCDASAGLTVLSANIPAGGDAYDRGLEVWVNDAIFTPPALVDVTDTTLTAGPVTMSGMNVTVQYRASGGTVGHTLRTLASFQNPSLAPLTVTVKWVSNLGSGAGTTVEGTANGNTSFSIQDPWVVTSDGLVPPGDAVNTFVLFGPTVGPRSPRVTPSAVSQTVFTCGGTEGILATYAVTVPPGRTRRLMFLNQISDDVEEALRRAAVFSKTHPAGVNVTNFVLDLTPVQRSEILNWDFTLKGQAADFDGDGRADIVTGTGFGGGTHVRVWSFPSGATAPIELFGFFAFDPSFTGGVRVAACDLNGDGVPDLITSAGPGGGAHVRSFDGVTLEPLPGAIGSFFPYDPGYVGGTYVSCGDINGDGVPDIVTGTGVGGGPHVRVWNGVDGSEIFGFFPYDPGFTGGVFVTTH